MKISWRRAILWLLVAAQLIFIFGMSAQDAPTSSEASGKVAQVVARLLSPGFDDLADEARAALVEKYQHVTRKAAHLAEYAMLCGLLTLALCDYKKRGAMAALLISILCAALDELSQLSSEGRSAQLTDVFIDSAGAMLGMAAAMLLLYLLKRAGSRR